MTESYADAYKMTFPVMGSSQHPSVSDIDQICGTAFSLGGDLFMTAGHAVRAASEHEVMSIIQADNETRDYSHATATEVDVWPDVDVGLIKADLSGAAPLIWTFSTAFMLQDVATMGYPHAIDRVGVTKFISIRSLKGYVVSSGEAFGRNFPEGTEVYELSFQCPKQISGAPLLLAGPPARVIGVIVGNSETSIQIGRETEDVGEGEQVYVRDQTTFFGMAIQSTELATRSSPLLDGTLHDHLSEHGLMSDD